MLLKIRHHFPKVNFWLALKFSVAPFRNHLFTNVCVLQCLKTFKTYITWKAEEKFGLVSSNTNLSLYLIFCGHILKTSVHILDTSLHFCASLHVFSFCSEVQIYEKPLKTLQLPLYCFCGFFWFIIIAHHGNCFSVHLHAYCSMKVVWHISPQEKEILLFSSFAPKRAGVNKFCMRK